MSEPTPISAEDVRGAGLMAWPASHRKERRMAHLAMRLQTLARRINEFIRDQLRRIEDSIDRIHATCASAAESQQRAGEIERQKALWQRERAEELKRIEQMRTHLEQAWLRIETEQRQMAAQQSYAAAVHAAQPGDLRQPGEADTAPAGCSGPTTSRVESPIAESWDAQPRELVLLQFQEVQADIRKHAQRERRAK